LTILQSGSSFVFALIAFLPLSPAIASAQDKPAPPIEQQAETRPRRVTQQPAVTPEPLQQPVEQPVVEGVVVPDAPKSYAKKLDLLYDVMDALIKQRVCKMGYRSLRKEKASLRQVEPLTLLTHKQGLYLLARERGEERVLTFAVDRIASFDAGTETFDYPSGYSPQQQTEGAFGLVSGKDRHKVVLEFTAAVAQLVVERRFHPSQKARRAASGGVILEMTLGNLSAELLSFVLSYGPDVRVVQPPALQAQAARAHKVAAAQYK